MYDEIKQIVCDIAPELASTNPAKFGRVVGYAREQINCALGDYGLALAVAHMLTLSAASASGSSTIAAGPVTAESEGQLSRTFANLADGQNIPAYWGQSKYGLEFWQLSRKKLFHVMNRFT